MISTVITNTSLGTAQIWFVTIIGGLAVTFIPFVLKYFNKKFSQITATAMKVDKHHRDNKKRFKKLREQNEEVLKAIAMVQETKTDKEL